jgi:hypothetical protein
VKENAIQQLVRLALSEAGATMFRNNVGATHTPDGRLIRYGVCNPGGSDLIGWKSVEITPDMVGKKVAVFTAVEVKGPQGRPTADQMHFLATVARAGGLAGIARSPEDATAILKR